MIKVSRALESHNVGLASSVLNSVMNFKGKGESLDSNLSPSQPYCFGFRHSV